VATRAAGAVNAPCAFALLLAAVFAIGDWIAKARHDRPLEYVCKPATLVALIAAALALDPAADAQTRRGWFVAALVLSLAGDVLLMLDDEDHDLDGSLATQSLPARRPHDLFVAGLAAFLVAHLCYVAGFWTDPPAGWALAAAVVAVVVCVSPFAARILDALRQKEPALRVPVGAYIAVISAMVASALATGNVAAGAGAVVFASSDTMIAWNRFVRSFRGAEVAIMVTYHLGQAGLVLSLIAR
jgi:uncharacterized membrane protein YhhN